MLLNKYNINLLGKYCAIITFQTTINDFFSNVSKNLFLRSTAVYMS